eukprot:403348735
MNDLATLVDLSDKEEQKLLHQNLVFDSHLDEREKLGQNLFGFDLIKAQNNEVYTPDIFIHNAVLYNNPQMSIDDQIQWLSKELCLVKQQSKQNLSQLKENIQEENICESEREQAIKQKIYGLREAETQQLIQLETKQIAESIVRIKASKPLHQKTEENLPQIFTEERFQNSPIQDSLKGYKYLIEFDPSLKLDDQWVTDQELHYLNILREDMNISIRQSSQRKFKKLKKAQEQDLKRRQERQQTFEEEIMGFCHHCKQYKVTYILAKCNYKSQVHGLLLPLNQEVNCLTIPNVEPQNTELVNHYILDKTILDKKKKKQYVDQVENNCNRQFCSFCLKNIYDVYLIEAQNNKDWICPCCKGNCYCTRCLRQDQLTRVRGILISNSLKEIQKHYKQPSKILERLIYQDNFIDNRIKSNFDRIARTCRISPLAIKDYNNDAKKKAAPLFLEQFIHEDPINYLFFDQKIKQFQVPKKRMSEGSCDWELRKYHNQLRIDELSGLDKALKKSKKLIDQINGLQNLQSNNNKQNIGKIDSRKRDFKQKTKRIKLNKKLYNDVSMKKLMSSSDLTPPSLMSSAQSHSTADSQDMGRKSTLDIFVANSPRVVKNKNINPKANRNKIRQIKLKSKLKTSKKSLQKKKLTLKNKQRKIVSLKKIKKSIHKTKG